MSLRSVEQVALGITGVLEEFGSGSTRAFSIGDGTPEAVVLTWDEFEDLGGEGKFAAPWQVPAAQAGPAVSELLRGIRAGVDTPPLVTGRTEPEAVVLSTAQYRFLRGDDEPPAGVADDPTQRTYLSEPLAGSRPYSLDEVARLMGPEAVRDLDDLRRDGEN